MLDVLYAPAQWMAGRPERALTVAVVFAAATLLLRAARRRYPDVADRPALLCTALWLFWGINEHAARIYGWDVRIDVVFLWPILAFVTVGCVLVTLASVRQARRLARAGSAAAAPDPPPR